MVSSFQNSHLLWKPEREKTEKTGMVFVALLRYMFSIACAVSYIIFIDESNVLESY